MRETQAKRETLPKIVIYQPPDGQPSDLGLDPETDGQPFNVYAKSDGEIMVVFGASTSPHLNIGELYKRESQLSELEVIDLGFYSIEGAGVKIEFDSLKKAETADLNRAAAIAEQIFQAISRENPDITSFETSDGLE